MSTIETIKSNYLEQVKKEFPDLNEDEVWEYVLNYFPYFKERIKTWDKIEYSFLGVGTVRTSSSAVRNWLANNIIFQEKFENHPENVKEKLKYIKSNREKIVPVLEEVYKDVEKYVLGGRTSRGQAGTLRRKLAREANDTTT